MRKPIWIEARWPAVKSVRTRVSTRAGGVSEGPYATCNVGLACGDDPRHVAENRRRMLAACGCPNEPIWLHQVHGNMTVRIPITGAARLPEADAVVTDQPGMVCAIQSADCLPILLCKRDGSRVAALHAGWRGLCAGIIQSCLHAMATDGRELLAWLGPAIGPRAFEVGPEVRSRFLQRSRVHDNAFRRGRKDRYMADLFQLARNDLQEYGVSTYGGGVCTYSDPERFFSFRRDGVTGRMAALIWMDPG